MIKLHGLKGVDTIGVKGHLAAPEVRLDSAQLLGRAARLGQQVVNLGGGAVLNRLWHARARPGLCASTTPIKMP